MGPIRTRSIVVGSMVVIAVVGVPLLAARGDDPPPDGAQPALDSVVDTSLVDSTALDSTTVQSTPVGSTVESSVAEPSSTTTVAPPVVVAAAGDLSCPAGSTVTPERCQGGAISDALLAEPDLQHFLVLGDVQYPSGTPEQFEMAYDPTFGRLKAITRPAAGNHEYGYPEAAGYFGYFGEAAGTPGEGWYSFDVGSSWHVVALNSNCGDVSCDAGAAQEEWLRADLAQSDRPCTLAYWHHPVFSSGEHHGSSDRTAPFWQALQDDAAELVLAGHDHAYERFAPQLLDGTPSDVGIRSFVVGTGGRSLYSFADTPELNSEVRLSEFGYLRLTLADDGYTFEFVATDGTVLDSGTGTCFAPPAPPPPSSTEPSSTPAP